MYGGQAYSAEIIVTTTEDIEKDDKECSLREAVEYLNRGLAKRRLYGLWWRKCYWHHYLKRKRPMY